MNDLRAWGTGQECQGHWCLWRLLYDDGEIIIRLYHYTTIDNIDEIMDVVYKNTQILSLSVVEESYAYGRLLGYIKKYGAEFMAKYTFFEVNDSEVVETLTKSSACLMPREEMKHMMIGLTEHFVDIVSDEWPEIVRNSGDPQVLYDE